MKDNTKGRSINKEHREKQIEEKNTNQYIIRLMNLYHSVDLRYGTDEWKQQAKETLCEEMMDQVKNTNSLTKGKLKVFMNNKEIWEKEKEHIY